jgi:hypothetical protein
MAKIKLRQDDAIFAVRACLGNLSEASARLGVCRQTLYTFAKAHPKVRAAIAHGRAVIVDKAERKLVDAVEAGESWAISLVLRTLGKWRGYIEAKDLTPRGQCRLPQGDGVDGPDDDDDEWAASDGHQLHRVLKGRLEDAADDEDWPDPDPEPEPDWAAREAELIRCFHAERQTLLERIRELEAAPAVSTADPRDDAEVMAEIARLTRIAEDLQRRVQGPS